MKIILEQIDMLGKYWRFCKAKCRMDSFTICFLKYLNNVILTPHVAGIIEEPFRAMMRDAFRNIASFENGRIDEIRPYVYFKENHGRKYAEHNAGIY